MTILASFPGRPPHAQCNTHFLRATFARAGEVASHPYFPRGAHAQGKGAGEGFRSISRNVGRANQI